MNFLTTGDIAEKLNIDRDTVSYAIRKTNTKPVGRAGLVRLFPETALVVVKRFLKLRSEARKETVKC